MYFSFNNYYIEKVHMYFMYLIIVKIYNLAKKLNFFLISHIMKILGSKWDFVNSSAVF